MSHFSLAAIDKKEEMLGVWVRWDSPMCTDIQEEIKKSRLLRKTDKVDRVIITEVNVDGKELIRLQVWAKSILDMMKMKNRYNVFNIVIRENFAWTCEGDLGRGMGIIEQ
jgi:hypothetical protein